MCIGVLPAHLYKGARSSETGVTAVVAGNWTGSSGRAASALNHRAVSPAQPHEHPMYYKTLKDRGRFPQGDLTVTGGFGLFFLIWGVQSSHGLAQHFFNSLTVSYLHVMNLGYFHLPFLSLILFSLLSTHHSLFPFPLQLKTPHSFSPHFSYWNPSLQYVSFLLLCHLLISLSLIYSFLTY